MREEDAIAILEERIKSLKIDILNESDGPRTTYKRMLNETLELNETILQRLRMGMPITFSKKPHVIHALPFEQVHAVAG